MKTYITIFLIAMILNSCGQSSPQVTAQPYNWEAAYDAADPDEQERVQILFEEKMRDERAASLFETMQLLDSLSSKGECQQIRSLWEMGLLRKVTDVQCEDSTLLKIGLLLTSDAYFDDNVNFEASISHYPALASVRQKLEIQIRHLAHAQVEPFYFQGIGTVDLSIRTFDKKVTNSPTSMPYSIFLMNLISEIYMVSGDKIKIPKAEYLSFENRRGITDEYNKCVNRRKFILFLKQNYNL